MELNDLKKQLEEIKANRQRAEVIYHQLNGQMLLLEDLIKKEEAKPKETTG